MRVDTEFPFVQRPRATFSQPSPGLRLLREHPPDITALVEAVRTLNTADAFRPRFTGEDWRVVGCYLMRHTLGSGDALVREDEPGFAAFLVESGTLLACSVPSRTGAASVALLRAGALQGAMALFGNMPSPARVDAISPSVVWSLDRPRLDRLLAGHPRLACEFLRAAGSVMRLRMRTFGGRMGGHAGPTSGAARAQARCVAAFE
jgi:CRP/FNR family cyclic AMP-dependent transcriptional regulator